MIPEALAARANLGPVWSDWLRRLPGLVQGLLGDWELTVDGAPTNGYGSMVIPVRRADQLAMLKVGYDGDDDNLHEGLALRYLGEKVGNESVVRLLRADPHRRALLLERLEPGTDMYREPLAAALDDIVKVLQIVGIPAHPALPLLSDKLLEWLDTVQRFRSELPREMVVRVQAIGRRLAADPATNGILTHGDLHYGNVLAAARGWVMIDPQPLSGDQHFEAAPLLWNRWADYGTAVRSGARARLDVVVDGLGLDEERAREWALLRLVVNAAWTGEDAANAGRGMNQDEQNWISRCLTLATALTN